MIMSGPDWKRLWTHFPGGLLGAYLHWFHWSTGLIFNGLFIVYEIVQDWRTGDSGFKDILGHVAGYATGCGIWSILSLLGVL